MAPDDLDALVGALSELPVASFVEVLQGAFDVRRGDVALAGFERRYALVVLSLLLSSDGAPQTDEMHVEFVARLNEPPDFDDLSQGGGCTRCRQEAISTNKNATCAACGAPAGLT
ncbi:MAG: hypothetical protein AB7Q27_25100 [Acidimicrobiia bacterium]